MWFSESAMNFHIVFRLKVKICTGHHSITVVKLGELYCKITHYKFISVNFSIWPDFFFFSETICVLFFVIRMETFLRLVHIHVYK